MWLSRINVTAVAEKTGEHLIALHRDVAVITSNYATKADVSELKAAIAEAKSSIIICVVSAIFLVQLIPALPNVIAAVGKLFR